MWFERAKYWGKGGVRERLGLAVKQEYEQEYVFRVWNNPPGNRNYLIEHKMWFQTVEYGGTKAWPYTAPNT